MREITLNNNPNDDEVSHTLTSHGGTETTASTSSKSAKKKKGYTATSTETSIKMFVRDHFFSCEKFITQMERVLSNQQPANDNDKQTGKVYRMMEDWLLDQSGKNELTDFAWTVKEMQKFCSFLNHKRGEVSTAIKTETWSELFIGRVVFFAATIAKANQLESSLSFSFLMMQSYSNKREVWRPIR